MLTTVFEAIEPLVDYVLPELCNLVVVPQVQFLCDLFTERFSNPLVLLMRLLLLVAEVVDAIGDMLQHTFKLLEAAVDIPLKLVNAALLLGKR